MLTQVALVRAEMAKEGLAALAVPLDEVKITSMTFVTTHTRVKISSHRWVGWNG